MHRKTLPILVLFVMVFTWSCDVTESSPNAGVEETIAKIISADNESFGFQGWGDEEFTLDKDTQNNAAGITMTPDLERDSSYIWNFRKIGMQHTREMIIEVEDDTSALALITDHVTGTFHIRQFDRYWITDTRWVRGDSVQFSQKNIDYTLNHRVAFRKRMNAAGQEFWEPMATTLVTGGAGETVSINSLNWVRGDSVFNMSDFESSFYPTRGPVAYFLLNARQINMEMGNSSDASELVKGRLEYYRTPDRPGMSRPLKLRYRETLDSGDKVYGGRIARVNGPVQFFQGTLEVLDSRTLFDHAFTDYSNAVLAWSFEVHHR